MSNNLWAQERELTELINRRFRCDDTAKTHYTAETRAQLPAPTARERVLLRKYLAARTALGQLEKQLFGSALVVPHPTTLRTASQQKYLAQREAQWAQRVQAAEQFWITHNIRLILAFPNQKALAAILEILK